jgi:RNA polymerase sporulation-specific sigma factor
MKDNHQVIEVFIFIICARAIKGVRCLEKVKDELLTRFCQETDEQLVCKAQVNDEFAFDCLLERYKNFVRSKARSYFLIGADREDIVQEGMIGLYKAVRDFRGDKMSSFKAFAELCVTRQIITAIKTATRQKHIPLNSYVSLNKPVFDKDSDRSLMDILCGDAETNPEEILIDNEKIKSMRERIGKLLSRLEWEVLAAYMDGRSYQEIALDMDKSVKSIDNALQRVKKKLEKLLISA